MSFPKLREWFVVFNPVANAGINASLQADIEKELQLHGFDFESCTTERALHAIDLVESAVISGYRKIISVGGGGTLNEAVNGVLEQSICPLEDIEFIHIPTGDINDWALHHKVPTDYKRWIPMLKNAPTKLHDVGVAHYEVGGMACVRYFLCNAGAALSGAIVRTLYADYENTGFSRSEVRKSVLKLASTLSYFDLKLSYNNQQFRDKYVIVHLALGNYFGRYRYTKDASAFDGEFTFMRDRGSVPAVRYFLTLFRLFRGNMYDSKQFVTTKTSKLDVDAAYVAGKNYIHVDGEFLAPGNVSFEISSHKLNIRLPR